jgi:hypothetical protein
VPETWEGKVDLWSNGVEEPRLSEMLRKSSGDVVFNYAIHFLRKTRIMGRI